LLECVDHSCWNVWAIFAGMCGPFSLECVGHFRCTCRYHLAWIVPMADVSYYTPSAAIHSFMMFVPFFITRMDPLTFIQGLVLWASGPFLAVSDWCTPLLAAGSGALPPLAACACSWCCRLPHRVWLVLAKTRASLAACDHFTVPELRSLASHPRVRVALAGRWAWPKRTRHRVRRITCHSSRVRASLQ
jgi:hypothetical protein